MIKRITKIAMFAVMFFTAFICTASDLDKFAYAKAKNGADGKISNTTEAGQNGGDGSCGKNGQSGGDGGNGVNSLYGNGGNGGNGGNAD